MILYAKIYFLVFGILTILGGAMGAMKGSMISLVAGGISGALLILAYALPASKVLPSLLLGLVVSVVLAGRFAPVFFKDGGFMPAGLMTLLSILGIVVSVVALLKR